MSFEVCGDVSIRKCLMESKEVGALEGVIMGIHAVLRGFESYYE